MSRSKGYEGYGGSSSSLTSNSSDTTVDWVIRVANSICDPSCTGWIYWHATGTLSYWYHRDRDASWQQVIAGDPLLSGIYEFESTSSITLSKISRRQSHSMTSLNSESSATTFCRLLDERDGGCVVTASGSPSTLIASHLIPKRMGTDGAKEVVTRFVGAQHANNIHRFHPSIGVLLLNTLGAQVDCYKLGFYYVTVSLRNYTTI
jgi:hypothetical protein